MARQTSDSSNPKRKLSSIETTLVKRVTAELGENIGNHIQLLFEGRVQGLTGNPDMDMTIRQIAQELKVNLRHSHA